MTEGQGSIGSGVGNCSTFYIVKEHKKWWRNCICHDIIGVFNESDILNSAERTEIEIVTFNNDLQNWGKMFVGCWHTIFS